MLYSEYTGKAIRGLNAMFLLLGRSLINREIELPLFDENAGVEQYGLLKDLLLRLLAEITDPAVPFTSAPDRKEACPVCSYRYICGTQWVVK